MTEPRPESTFRSAQSAGPNSSSFSLHLSQLTNVFLVISVLFASGCAIHYYDPETGAEHIWGFGHLVMKASAPKEGHRAIVRGTDTIGFSAGNLGGQGYLTLGWQNQRMITIVSESTAISLEWPDSDFLRVRVGSDWPSRARNEQTDKKDTP